MMDINSIDIDNETRVEIINLYYHNYKTTIRISKMLQVPLPAVKAIVRHHNRVLLLGTTADATVFRSKSVKSTKPTAKKSPQSSSSSDMSKCGCSNDGKIPCDEHAALLSKLRSKDNIKCPILQYV